MIGIIEFVMLFCLSSVCTTSITASPNAFWLYRGELNSDSVRAKPPLYYKRALISEVSKGKWKIIRIECRKSYSGKFKLC